MDLGIAASERAHQTASNTMGAINRRLFMGFRLSDWSITCRSPGQGQKQAPILGRLFLPLTMWSAAIYKGQDRAGPGG